MCFFKDRGHLSSIIVMGRIPAKLITGSWPSKQNFLTLLVWFSKTRKHFSKKKWLRIFPKNQHQVENNQPLNPSHERWIILELTWGGLHRPESLQYHQPHERDKSRIWIPIWSRSILVRWKLGGRVGGGTGGPKWGNESGLEPWRKLRLD